MSAAGQDLGGGVTSPPPERIYDGGLGLEMDRKGTRGLPLFSCPLAELVPSVEHHAAAEGEERRGLEAPCGQVALY